nr:hypothetical protein [Gammaproteobacteria bacterium AqS3]
MDQFIMNSALQGEKETLNKVNDKLSELMGILRNEATTPFSDAIILLNMLSCTKSIAGVVGAKLATISNSQKAIESLSISQGLEKTCMKLSGVENDLNNTHVDAAELSDMMITLASHLLGGEFFVVKDTGDREESDTHRIYTF